MSAGFDDPRVVTLLLTQWTEPDDGSWWWSTYGITEAVRNEIVRLQNGRCPICTSTTSLVVDHCHATGRVRGLICGSCNTRLGSNKDDPARMRVKSDAYRAAADYIEHARALPRPHQNTDVTAAASAPLVQRVTRRPSLEPRYRRPGDEQLLDMWPPRRLIRMPTRRIELHTRGRGVPERWSCWCPNDRVEKEVAGDPTHIYWCRTDYVGRLKGIEHTGDLLMFDADTPEKSVGVHASAFVHMYFDVSIAMRDPDAGSIWKWLRGQADMLIGGDGVAWHHATTATLPTRTATADDIENIRSVQDLVDLLLVDWRELTEKWTILDFVVERTVAA